MRKWLSVLRPNPWLARRLMMLAVLAAVGVSAFCLGRHGAPAEAAQPGGTGPVVGHVTATPGARTDDYSRRVIAYVYGNVPVMREELGEYLIARFGKERIDFLINRKLVEMACQAQKITVTDAEVDVQLAQDIASFGANMTLDGFVNQVLKRFNKSLFEWKEDVIRPKLEMTKLVRPLVKVTPDDERDEFEARYGPKVKCRMIVLDPKYPRPLDVWEKVRQSEDAFMKAAMDPQIQFIPQLQSCKGEMPAIYKHFPDPKIEKEAFLLEPGQVSSVIGMPDKTTVILRCEQRIAADASKRLEDERVRLHQEVFDKKLAVQIPQFFQRLRDDAKVRIEPPFNQTPPPVVAAPKMVPPPVGN
jgi:hypothetical protein